jgi:hypothetical protein
VAETEGDLDLREGRLLLGDRVQPKGRLVFSISASARISRSRKESISGRAQTLRTALATR